jgi:hypothetical protein
MNARQCSLRAVIDFTTMIRAVRGDMHVLLALGGLLLALATGCDRLQTAEQARQRQIHEHPQFELPSAVAKFAGRVTVDGKPPKRNCRLFVILNDPRHLEQTANGERPRLFVACESNGDFSFTTYQPHDGVVAGKYVVTFVELHRIFYGPSTRAIRTSPLTPGPERYPQPDELHNLYNDPDKNAKIDEFVIDLQPPGSSHHNFALVVAGKKPVHRPGPNAVVGVAEEG